MRRAQSSTAPVSQNTKHVWTLDDAPARAGRRPGALAEYKALRDASCVWRPAVLSHKLLILRNDGQTEVETASTKAQR